MSPQAASPAEETRIGGTAPCRLCGGAALPQFRRRVLGRYDVQYLRCRACGSLQTEEPYWLAEAYGQAIGSSDVGVVHRSLTNRAAVWWILKVFALSRGKLLDFGGGTGLLCRLLRDIGIDAWTCDAHHPGELAQSFQVEWNEVRPGAFQTITAMEVLEHLARPAEELRGLFARQAAILVASTEVYSAECGADWWYLAPEGGQHIFFYSTDALARVAAAAGYHFLRFGSWCVFSRRPVGKIKRRLLALGLQGPLLRLARLRLELVPVQCHLAGDYRRVAALSGEDPTRPK